MTDKNKLRLNLALMNASEIIRGHVEVGIDPEDLGKLDESGLEEYSKACERACKLIEKLAKKYNISNK